jgi:polysaccharide export outer membrane protein
LGEVKSPGSFLIPNERITVIEAISLAGDLSIYGERKTVMLIRESEGKRNFIRLDLTNKEIFNSPYYYLAQNDIIYVEPNKTKINSSATGATSGIIISSISTLISLVSLIAIIYQ